jgi:hypothetical protein
MAKSINVIKKIARPPSNRTRNTHRSSLAAFPAWDLG